MRRFPRWHGRCDITREVEELLPKKTPMNTTILSGEWNLVKGQLKQIYARLTHNDLVYVEGREDELVGRLQLRAGAVWDQVSRLLRAEARQH